MLQTLEKIKGGLIVSCQALPEEPLYSSFIMSRMAVAAAQSGAVGIRANSIVDIQAIKDVVNLPLIGIIKKVYEDSGVYITPTLKEVRAVCATGAEIVAMDCTCRKRPNDEKLVDILAICRKEYPNTLFMADTGDLQDVALANQLKFDLIGTTLHGYTQTTVGLDISNQDFSYLKDVLNVSEVPVIAEGKIDTPQKAKRVLSLGAYAVVSGGAITRPQEITKKFVDAIEE